MCAGNFYQLMSHIEKKFLSLRYNTLKKTMKESLGLIGQMIRNIYNPKE